MTNKLSESSFISSSRYVMVNSREHDTSVTMGIVVVDCVGMNGVIHFVFLFNLRF